MCIRDRLPAQLLLKLPHQRFHVRLPGLPLAAGDIVGLFTLGAPLYRFSSLGSLPLFLSLSFFFFRLDAVRQLQPDVDQLLKLGYLFHSGGERLKIYAAAKAFPAAQNGGIAAVIVGGGAARTVIHMPLCILLKLRVPAE